MKKIKTILALILVISYNLICYRYWLRVWVWSTCLTGKITWFLFTILHSKSTWEILAVMLEIISLKYTFFRFINQSISWFRYNCNICIALKCFIVWKFFIILINNDIVLVFHRHTSYICMILQCELCRHTSGSTYLWYLCNWTLSPSHYRNVYICLISFFFLRQWDSDTWDVVIGRDCCFLCNYKTITTTKHWEWGFSLRFYLFRLLTYFGINIDSI